MPAKVGAEDGRADTHAFTVVEEEIDLTGVEKSLSKRGIISTQIERPLKQTMVDNVLGHITEMWKKAERPCVLVSLPLPLALDEADAAHLAVSGRCLRSALFHARPNEAPD